MNSFEFIGYEPAAPGEKYLGIATVRCWGKIILRYKVTAGKEGRGYFTSEASYKNGTKADGKDRYEKCWMIDSNFENELLRKCLEENIKPYESQKTQPQSQYHTPQYQPQQVNTPYYPPQNRQSSSAPMQPDYTRYSAPDNETVPF